MLPLVAVESMKALTITESPTVVIHHLTDIHVGPLHYQPARKISLRGLTEAAVNSRNGDLYLQFLRELPPNDRPDLLIASGDLTSHASIEQLRTAERFLRNALRLLQEKTAGWRNQNRAPWIFVVPGNHDLDWSKPDNREKISGFEEMADSLFQEGAVISAAYRDSEAPTYWDFGDEINLFVYLLNSTSLGGTEDQALRTIYETLQRQFEAIESGKDSTNAAASALGKLEEAARRDPGFISPEDLSSMREVMGRVPSGRLKVAVMHHNLTSVASDDLETFDAIINAGTVKSFLMRYGFDLVLHGHRHFLHFEQERFLRHSAGDQNGQQGLFIIGGESFGCEEKGPFLEMRIYNPTQGHGQLLPTTLLEVREVKRSGDAYETAESPAFQEPIGRPLYSGMRNLLVSMGRLVHPSDRSALENVVAQVKPAIESLSEGLGKWGHEADKWISNFHIQLSQYHSIYAVDVGGRRAAESPRFDLYLREQFKERLRKLMRSPTPAQLVFSPRVYGAILRTGWRPDDSLWAGVRSESSSSSSESSLEIVRILIRNRELSRRDRDSLECLDIDHRLHGVPLFVIESGLETGDKADFALGLSSNGEPVRCYEYSEAMGEVREVRRSRGEDLRTEIRATA